MLISPKKEIFFTNYCSFVLEFEDHLPKIKNLVKESVLKNVRISLQYGEITEEEAKYILNVLDDEKADYNKKLDALKKIATDICDVDEIGEILDRDDGKYMVSYSQDDDDIAIFVFD